MENYEMRSNFQLKQLVCHPVCEKHFEITNKSKKNLHTKFGSLLAFFFFFVNVLDSKQYTVDLTHSKNVLKTTLGFEIKRMLQIPSLPLNFIVL